MDSNTQRSFGLVEFLSWFELNKKRLIIWVGAGIVVVLLVVAFVQHQAAKETTASEALSEIRIPLNFGTPVPLGTSEALDKVSKEYPGTKAGARALLQSASVCFTEGRWDQALERFEKLPKEYPESPWLAEAAFGAASSLDAQGKKSESLAKYEELRRRFPNSPVADDAKLAVARLYSGDPAKVEEAYKVYDEIMKVNPPQYTAIGREAALRQENLLKSNPQLEKLRNPPPPPPTPVVIPQPTIVSNVMNKPGATGQTITIPNRPNAVPPMIARPPEPPPKAEVPPATPPPTPPPTTPVPK